MRTTLDIDEDVLIAAKEIAATSNTTIGKVISELARKGLRPSKPWVKVRNGVPLLAPRDPTDRVVTTDFINQLRDEGP